MIITVRLPGPLRDLVGGAHEVEVDVPGGHAGVTEGASATVGAMLDGLAGTHPGLERRIRDEQGNLRPHVNLFVNGDNVKDLDGSATPLGPGDELTILPAVSGGAPA